ncbi:hypothetical protein SXCC_00974 [Gluconacetobacter sp. SXCC-1]|nr:hypothetical protein SXCC_00974 [Gluconacetobacter sp. SXCC-1]
MAFGACGFHITLNAAILPASFPYGRHGAASAPMCPMQGRHNLPL